MYVVIAVGRKYINVKMDKLIFIAKRFDTRRVSDFFVVFHLVFL